MSTASAVEKLSDDLNISSCFTVSEADMTGFAALSGDRNPLHVDTAYAREKGFKGPVVYGAFLLAKLSELIGMQLPTQDLMWIYNDIQFHAPVYVGESVTLTAETKSVSEATGLIELRITFTVGEIRVAKGKCGLKVLG